MDLTLTEAGQVQQQLLCPVPQVLIPSTLIRKFKIRTLWIMKVSVTLKITVHKLDIRRHLWQTWFSVCVPSWQCSYFNPHPFHNYFSRFYDEVTCFGLRPGVQGQTTFLKIWENTRLDALTYLATITTITPLNNTKPSYTFPKTVKAPSPNSDSLTQLASESSYRSEYTLRIPKCFL